MGPGPSEHCRSLMGLDLDGRLAYLEEQGMGPVEVAGVVGLTSGWLDHLELGRLEALSRRVASSGGELGELLGARPPRRCRVRLAVLVMESGLGDPGLAVSYALCRALLVASASLRADRVSLGPPLVFLPEDGL